MPKFSIGDRVQLDFTDSDWDSGFARPYQSSGVGIVLKTDDSSFSHVSLITVKFDNLDFTIDDWNDLCFCLEVIDDYCPNIPEFRIDR